MDHLAGLVMAADLVLRGGRVWAGKGLPPATALAVRDGRVVAVGADAEVAPWISDSTKVIELAGRLAVPGFNDAHVHFLSGGFGLLSVDLRAPIVADVGEPKMAAPTGLAHRIWVASTLQSHAGSALVATGASLSSGRQDR